MNTTTDLVTLPGSSRTFLGHPPGLFHLFFAEMWERFSYYGMRALLIFYLTKHFLFGDDVAAGIHSTYGSLVYLMPVLGGLVADRWLGARKAVIFGAILLCVGHLGMAIEGPPAQVVDGAVQREAWSLQVFYLSLALIIVGVGFLKASISTMVGQLYGADDPRRDGGFTLFYMGINLGAFFAALICGYLGETWGWRYGFGLAGIGMLLGLVTFIRGAHLLAGIGPPPQPALLAAPLFGALSRERLIQGAGLLAVVVAWGLMQWRDAVGGLLIVAGVASALGIVVYAFWRCTPLERDRLLVLLLLIVVSVVFWALFEQAGSSINLFTDRNVDREVFGLTIAASQFQSVNPGFIMLLAPLFALLWPWLAARGREPGTPAKFALAVIQVGLGFVALVVGAARADEGSMVAVGWLVLAYLLHTTGELCLSPVGLSAVTRLSVPRIVGFMMGVWFLASAFSHYAGGMIAQLMTVAGEGGAVAGKAEALRIYASTFGQLAWIAVAVGVLLLVASPWLGRRIRGHEALSAEQIPSGN